MTQHENGKNAHGDGRCIRIAGGCQATSAERENTQTVAVQQQNLPQVDINYETFTLDNGLTVVVHEDKEKPRSLLSTYGIPSARKTKNGQDGFAHLFEHLMFNGSENYDEYFGPFERAGATEMNGTTNNDRTNYFENVPTPALDMALWMNPIAWVTYSALLHRIS